MCYYRAFFRFYYNLTIHRNWLNHLIACLFDKASIVNTLMSYHFLKISCCLLIFYLFYFYLDILRSTTDKLTPIFYSYFFSLYLYLDFSYYLFPVTSWNFLLIWSCFCYQIHSYYYHQKVILYHPVDCWILSLVIQCLYFLLSCCLEGQWMNNYKAFV